MAKKEEGNIRILEKGDIYFFYTPKVEQEHPESESDVQRFHMVLSSADREHYRLATIGRKRMPGPEKSGKARNWGFIEKVSGSPGPIREQLKGETYETKTRGERRQPAARPAGEGVYRILKHDDHTHLIYSLELPGRPGEVQDEFNIEDEASYIITVKNPETPSPPQAGLGKKQEAGYPKRLMNKFRGRKFAEAEPDFLDHEGAEFILVSASDDISEDLGLKLKTDKETPETADMIRDLGIDKSKRPTRPLFEGEWQ